VCPTIVTMAEETEVSTIFVAGLPVDATYRELENLVRFLPGYEAFKMASSRGKAGGGITLFAKFDLTFSATAALEVLNGVPFDTKNPDVTMRVEMARSDMTGEAQQREPKKPAPVMVHQALPVQKRQAPQREDWNGSWDQGARKRPKIDYGEVDTIVLLGQVEKGFTERQLEEYFSQCPGFLAWKPNRKVGGGFVKFSTPKFAVEAIDVAASSSIEATIARSSMTFAGGEPPAKIATGWSSSLSANQTKDAPRTKGAASKGYSKGSSGGVSKGSTSLAADPAAVDTIVLLGATEKGGYKLTELEEFFTPLIGFVALKANRGVGGAFVKFETHEFALEAMETSNSGGIEAKLARNSMNLKE